MTVLNIFCLVCSLFFHFRHFICCLIPLKQLFRQSIKAPHSKRPLRANEWLFFPRCLNAPPEAFPPSRRFDVTAVRLRTWIEKCRVSLSELGSPRPPPPAICQPASTTDSQPLAVLLLRGDPSLPSEPGRRFFFSPRLRGSPRAG